MEKSTNKYARIRYLKIDSGSFGEWILRDIFSKENIIQTIKTGDQGRMVYQKINDTKF